MLFVDIKYANMLSPRLRNFKQKGEYLWNFSCPVCGDSTKNKSKARGYIYKMKTALFVKCHKCGYSTNLGNFIKFVDTNMHREYVLEKYKENHQPQAQKPAEVKDDFFVSEMVTDAILDPLRRLDTLGVNHPAVKYVKGRQIPDKYLSLLYVAPQFKKYVNSLIPNKFKSVEDDHPRLIIPYFNRHGKCFAFQGRAFGNEEPKYFSIKLDEREDKIYGLERVNFGKRIYITEGPLDSLFLPNALAVSGSSFNTPTVQALKTNATIVYDNEPRSKELTKLISNTIDLGFSVCLWPETVQQKDINEMVKDGGMTSEEIVSIIDNNTFTGAAARLRFATWRKC